MDFDQKIYEEKSELLKVLAHPVRLCIVRGLMEHENCNVTYMKDCLKTSQSAMSQHLAKLKAANIVKCVRSGNNIYYKLTDRRLEKLIKDLFEKN
ncbi:MAG: metalloregulator ArsR/SmtB family transcription factor [Erysipelotrichaceae bacterium]|nr:metalloregulator ArsR/SmtB family transcription factor [Erysipelotrichaceae bacterium]